ncbi:glycosyltransferase family 2 protein [Pontibacter harenae]|uniref:glycosyltransferase family 2 protein n=1 Tax=Pontibacter harenae TaxID=2894083 RepID=UPI001E58E1F2|nr:glycosyltransferase family 2 protein [Pontibacter harenae]MCC9168231.1 glycosyltransferase [Pontibacter harenae]
MLLSKLPKTDNLGWPWNEETDSAIYANKCSWPKISIVTPSFNQGQFIEETIRSVLLQNYPNLEYIIIDGGSTDNTVEIIKKYEQWITYWISESDNGQSDAINKGLKLASGEVLNWLNSDDFLANDALFHIGSEDWNSEVGAVVGTGHKVNDEGVVLYTPKLSELSTEAFYNWIDHGHFMQPACFFSRNAWLSCGPINEQLFFCMDVELWIKISKMFIFKRIFHSIAFAHAHSNAKTTAFVDKMKIETYMMVAANGNFTLGRNLLYEFLERKVERNSLKHILGRLKHNIVTSLKSFIFFNEDINSSS